MNTNSTPHYPSSYDLPNVVSVSATDKNDRISTFSNYGYRNADMAAPGSSPPVISTTVTFVPSAA